MSQTNVSYSVCCPCSHVLIYVFIYFLSKFTIIDEIIPGAHIQVHLHFNVVKSQQLISMGYCKKDVTPVR